MDTEIIRQLKQTVTDYASMLGRRPRACIVTFGCQMNARDSEKLRGVLSASGFELTDSEDCDFLIYNTCTVRENANTRVYGRLGKVKSYKKKNPLMMVALCGCMMQEKSVTDEIRSKYGFVDLVFGTFNLDRFPYLLEDLLRARLEEQPCFTRVEIINSTENDADRLPSARNYPFKAGVNIMYGCNNFCSYCIVPYVRGRERSREPSEILEEIRYLREDGVREIMLLGQNVNSYGKTLNRPKNFAWLLDRIAGEFSSELLIRFMTSHPKDLSDDLIRVMEDHDNICEHIHLPVQAGSDRILQAMNRHYTREDYLALIDKIRSAMPDIAITTDIMVGFPSETEADIDQTIDLIGRSGFDNAFTFLYSRRTGTPAAAMEDQVDGKTASRWFDKVLEAVHCSARERNRRFAGRIMPVLVEQENRHNDGWISGRISHNLLVHFRGSPKLIGKIIPVKITESKGFYLMGETVSDED